jgi:hypothetical protein
MKQKYSNYGQTLTVYCDCGGDYNKKYESRHLKAKKHMDYEKNMEERWAKIQAEEKLEAWKKWEEFKLTIDYTRGDHKMKRKILGSHSPLRYSIRNDQRKIHLLDEYGQITLCNKTPDEDWNCFDRHDATDRVCRKCKKADESEDELCARLDAEYEADLEAKVEAQCEVKIVPVYLTPQHTKMYCFHNEEIKVHILNNDEKLTMCRKKLDHNWCFYSAHDSLDDVCVKCEKTYKLLHMKMK